MNITQTLTDFNRRLDTDHANNPEGCPCTTLGEIAPLLPYLRMLRDNLERSYGLIVDEVEWHTIVVAAAAGYAVGIADAFAGMDELANVVPLFPRDDNDPEAA